MRRRRRKERPRGSLVTATYRYGRAYGWTRRRRSAANLPKLSNEIAEIRPFLQPGRESTTFVLHEPTVFVTAGVATALVASGKSE